MLQRVHGVVVRLVVSDVRAQRAIVEGGVRACIVDSHFADVRTVAVGVVGCEEGFVELGGAGLGQGR